jgi:hypothetical protein
MAIWFPETKGLSLEEVGALFGDQVAVDLTHMTEEERRKLDDEIIEDKQPTQQVETVA